MCDDLPPSGRSRLALLQNPVFAGVQPVGWTAAEYRQRLQRGDPIATDAANVGVVVLGTVPAGDPRPH